MCRQVQQWCPHTARTRPPPHCPRLCRCQGTRHTRGPASWPSWGADGWISLPPACPSALDSARRSHRPLREYPSCSHCAPQACPRPTSWMLRGHHQPRPSCPPRIPGALPRRAQRRGSLGLQSPWTCLPGLAPRRGLALRPPWPAPLTCGAHHRTGGRGSQGALYSVRSRTFEEGPMKS